MSSKKRCGILAFHYASNFGAFLQGYSLFLSLRERLPHYKVEFINYRPPNAVAMYLDVFLPWRRLKTTVRRTIQLKRDFILALQYFGFMLGRLKYLPIGPKIPYEDYQEACKKINELYDVVVLGGDELWKIDKLRPYPNLYWLNKTIVSKKISFAPSAIPTDFSILAKSEREQIGLSLNSFSLLGVRDKYTEDALRHIISNHAQMLMEQVADPAFLVDIDHLPKLKSAPWYKKSKAKPAIGILLEESKFCRIVCEKLRHEGYFTVGLYKYHPYADFNVGYTDPLKWPSIFSKLDGCISRYFHGVVFSLLAGIPFIAVTDIYNRIEGYGSKIVLMFNLLGGGMQCHIDISDGIIKPQELVEKFKQIRFNWDRISWELEKPKELARRMCEKFMEKLAREVN